MKTLLKLIRWKNASYLLRLQESYMLANSKLRDEWSWFSYWCERLFGSASLSVSLCRLIFWVWAWREVCHRGQVVEKEWRRSFNGEIIESSASISHLYLAYYHSKYANHSKRPKWWIRTRFYVSTDVSPGQTMFASVNLRAKLRRLPNALANNRKFHHAVTQTIPENLGVIACKFERYQIESKSAQVHASCWKLVMTWDSVWPEL